MTMQKNLNNITKAFQGYSEAEAKKLLLKEGRRLEGIAKKVWRRTMGYKPKVYAVHLTGVAGKRTGRSERAIKLGKVKVLEDGNLGIELTWDNDLVYHESALGKKYEKTRCENT